MNLTPGLVKSVMGQAENRTQSGFIGSQIEFTKPVKDAIIGVRTGIFKSSECSGTFNHSELGDKF